MSKERIEEIKEKLKEIRSYCDSFRSRYYKQACYRAKEYNALLKELKELEENETELA